jgi:glycerate kinase
MKMLVAPNALKGSVSALDAIERIGRGMKRSGLEAIVDLMPIADGGEIREVEMLGLLGRPIHAEFGLIGDSRAALKFYSGLGGRPQSLLIHH